MGDVLLLPPQKKKARLNLILFISLHDNFTAQSAGSTLTMFITLHSKEAFPRNITVILARFPGERSTSHLFILEAVMA